MNEKGDHYAISPGGCRATLASEFVRFKPSIRDREDQLLGEKAWLEERRSTPVADKLMLLEDSLLILSWRFAGSAWNASAANHYIGRVIFWSEC